LHKEEAFLDHWLEFLEKATIANGGISSATTTTNEILQALLYFDSNDEPPKELLVNEEGKPQQAFLAIHTPYEGVAHIPQQPSDEGHHQLYVGSLAGLTAAPDDDDEDDGGSDSKKASSPTKRRKIPLQSHMGPPRKGDRIQVFLMPVAFDENTQRLASRGAEPVTMPTAAADDEDEGAVWPQAANALTHEEGVSDFFETSGAKEHPV